MEESVVDCLEKKSTELTKGDKNQERPDIIDVEYETGQEDDSEVLHNEESVHDQLAIEDLLAAHVLLLLLLLGGRRNDQVVHVEVADAV